jgi:hypothetical protein
MWLAAYIYQNVPRLNISMQDPSLVRIGNSAREFDDEFDSRPIGHWLTVNYFVKSPAFDQLHAEVAGTVTFTDLMNRNDAGVVQTRCRLGLKPKPFDVRFGGPPSEADDF